MRVVFRSPKRVADVLYFPADFLSFMQNGQTIVAAGTCTISVYQGVDANPSAMLSGAASVSGASVIQQLLTGGIAGNIYQLNFKPFLSDGQSPELCGYVYVQPDLP